MCLTDTSHSVTQGREVPTGAEHSARKESKLIENFKNQKDFLEEEFGGGLQKTAREASSVALFPLLASNYGYPLLTGDPSIFLLRSAGPGPLSSSASF